MGLDDPTVLRTTPHARIAELWVRVLQEEGFTATVAPAVDGFAVVVLFADADRAALVLEEIDRADETAEDAEEEEPKVVPLPPRPLPGWGRSWAGAATAWLLLAFYGVTGAANDGSPWTTRGAADTRLLRAEPWRAITALTLHADAGHILANAAAMLVFLTLAAWRLGPGGSVAVVLVSGILGNFAAALFHASNVVSLGASTAVFGALGLLVALALTDPTRRRGAWVVIAASLALLGFLGTSPGSDVIAHLTGWASGLAIGLPIAFAWRKPPAMREQILLAVISFAIVAGAWLLAFRAGADF